MACCIFAVLITPPPIPTRLWESSRIPTGFLLDFNKISKKAFSHIFSFPFLLDSYWTPTRFLLDSHWTPIGLQLNLYKVNAMDSYWIPTGLLTTLCNLITFYQYFNKSDLMPLENSIQQSYLSIDVALIAIYTIKYRKYFTHSKW